MFGLELDIFILLTIAIVAACAFEFINGFHDTANAVATVIYTNSLKPTQAVVWSGIMNFVGVITGGVGVGLSIVNLLPVELLIDQNVYQSIAMVLALLLSAIIWNFGTWYFGLPSSSSHTLIGAILGVGLGYALLPDNTMGVAAINWDKAKSVFTGLFLAPLIGFTMAVVLMFVIRNSVSKEIRQQITSEPKKNQKPPVWIRWSLIVTCTLVSFFHGRNDGQKGIGLMMLILIGILPSYFSINPNSDLGQLKPSMAIIEEITNKIDTTNLSQADINRIVTTREKVAELKHLSGKAKFSDKDNLELRKDVLLISSNVKKIVDNELIELSDADKKTLKKLEKTLLNQ